MSWDGAFYGEPMVLFRDHEGELICLRDRCPHRLAKLSDGQLIDGRLETVCKKKIKNREITTKTSKGQIKSHFSSNEATSLSHLFN